jgi:hypothetical protein
VVKNGPVNVMEPEPVVRPINKRLEKVDEPIVEKKWESHKNPDSPPTLKDPNPSQSNNPNSYPNTPQSPPPTCYKAK